MTGILENRVALITGAGQGVGQGIGRALAAGGAHVVIAQRNAEQGEQEAAFLREHHRVEAFFVRADATKAGQVDAMVKAASDRFGRLDILVNNAGASFPKRLARHTDEEMAASIDVNFWS